MASWEEILIINFIDTFIKLLCYIGAFIGLLLFVFPMITDLFKMSVTTSRFRQYDSNSKEGTKRKNKIIIYIQRILKVTFNIKSTFAAYNFLIISAGLGIIIFTILFSKGYAFNTSLLLAIATSLIPYTYLLIKLRNMRIEGSYEGNNLVKELINQYKINNLNMIEAIDRTIPFLKNSSYSEKALFRLSIEIKEYKNDEELHSIIDDFVFGIDTEWAILLGTNIYLAIHDGVDVRESLEDIIEELKIIKQILEDDKRNNIESFKMIKYAIPFAYGGSVYIAVKLFGFTIKRFFDYQFGNKMAIFLAIITFLLMAFNFLVFNIMKRPKYDY